MLSWKIDMSLRRSRYFVEPRLIKKTQQECVALESLQVLTDATICSLLYCKRIERLIA